MTLTNDEIEEIENYKIEVENLWWIISFEEAQEWWSSWHTPEEYAMLHWIIDDDAFLIDNVDNVDNRSINEDVIQDLHDDWYDTDVIADKLDIDTDTVKEYIDDRDDTDVDEYNEDRDDYDDEW